MAPTRAEGDGGGDGGGGGDGDGDGSPTIYDLNRAYEMLRLML